MVFCAIVSAMCVKALQLSSERLDVGRPIMLAAVLVICVSLTSFVSANMLKKKEEQ